MQVTRYLFQSPYSSPVQFGRVDPTTKDSSNSGDAQLLKSTNQTAVAAQAFEATQTKEVKPSVSGPAGSSLDIYA